MNRPDRIALVLLLAIAACGPAHEPDDSVEPDASHESPAAHEPRAALESHPSREVAANEEHFAAFAREVYAELKREPLDPILATDLGLFGDLSVNAGEGVVMGQFRYRLDSTQNGRTAYMAFQVRDAAGEYPPVPVVAIFTGGNDGWHLERSVFGNALTSPISSTDEGADDVAPPAEDAEVHTPVEQSLGAYVDRWMENAVRRASASKGQNRGRP